MALFIAGAGILGAAGGISGFIAWKLQEHRLRKERKIAAAALSAIFGVQIFCQEEAQRKINLDKHIKKLEIENIFNLKHEQLYYIPDSAYDPQYDCDFTDYEGDDTECTRGGYPYTRPAGYKRKALKVVGKYEDDEWLGEKGWRDVSSLGEWAVSYHVKKEKMSGIFKAERDELCRNRVARPGRRSIYSTPYINVAERYATDFNYEGENYKCILQNRVNLEKTRIVDAVDPLNGIGTFFVTSNKNNIRPYELCIKKV